MTTDSPSIPPLPPGVRIIEPKVSLTWLLSTTGVVLVFLASTLWAVAGQSNKLDALVTANVKMEKRMDQKDTGQETLRDMLYAQQRISDNNTIRITALEGSRK